eukprot:TRINITY_DN23661_c0_g1_i1.p2 TRINITY_DN23661_c0_g1~~TRINITY_DN23661_c0_g1_i1.p2  ORF type:complete len:248 (+),score=-7.30 TRINITY_DN23661_c0_g1_i1:432-1175(+)
MVFLPHRERGKYYTKAICQLPISFLYVLQVCNQYQTFIVNQKMQTAVKQYLIVYNLGLSVAWSCVFLLAVLSVFNGVHYGGFYLVYEYAGLLTVVIQLISVLETLHAAVGFIKSNPLMCFIQWIGRWNTIFFVVYHVVEVQQHTAAGLLILSWSAAEVCRYPWYCLNLCNIDWNLATFLRYSAFIPLYPIGTISEMMLIYSSLNQIKEMGLYTVKLPNKWNFGFDYVIFLELILFLYPSQHRQIVYK